MCTVKKISFAGTLLCAFFALAYAHCQKVERSQMLTGWVSKADLFEAAPSYETDYRTYEPNGNAVAIIASFERQLEIVVFLGTWCPDCSRETPKFIKTLELARNANISAKMLALDRSKKDEAGVADRYEIERIPTFVLLVEGREIGRIVEQVEMSIEEDIATLLVEVL